MKTPRNALHIALTALAAVCLVALAGCTRLSPEEALQKRSQEFWSLKVKKDYLHAYEYLDPVDRDRISLNDWLKGFGSVEWPSAQVVGVEVRGSRGLAEIKYRYVVLQSFARGQTGEDKVKEEWIQRKGKWYKVYVQPSLSAPQPGFD